MSGFDRLTALLERPGAVEQRPNAFDLHSNFRHESATAEDVASDWSWPSFMAGIIVGAIIGIALLGGGAILVTMRWLA